VAHPCPFKGAGFPTLDSYFPLPIAIRLFIARGVFGAGEKPAPFTKAVKSAAPGSLTNPHNLRAALMKPQTVEGAVDAIPACCHSERSKESLRGFAYCEDRDGEILRFAQNDT